MIRQLEPTQELYLNPDGNNTGGGDGGLEPTQELYLNDKTIAIFKPCIPRTDTRVVFK